MTTAELLAEAMRAASADTALLRERIAGLEAFAEWVKRHATEQAKGHREAGLADLAWCRVVDQAEAALTKSTV